MERKEKKKEKGSREEERKLAQGEVAQGAEVPFDSTRG